LEEQTKNTKCGNYVPGSDTKYSTDGMKEANQKKSTAIGGRSIYIAEGIRWKKARKKMGREGRECIDKRGICDKIRKNAERK
jgi:hypothetical protein